MYMLIGTEWTEQISYGHIAGTTSVIESLTHVCARLSKWSRSHQNRLTCCTSIHAPRELRLKHKYLPAQTTHLLRTFNAIIAHQAACQRPSIQQTTRIDVPDTSPSWSLSPHSAAMRTRECMCLNVCVALSAPIWRGLRTPRRAGRLRATTIAV